MQIIYRAMFEKQGLAVYVSHLDMQRAVMRAIKKAKIPAKYSEGFNPHLYLTFALPLPLGQAGLQEIFDFKAEEGTFDIAQAISAMNMALPSGVKVKAITIAKEKPSSITNAVYTINYSACEDTADFEAAIIAYNSAAVAVARRKNKKGELVEVQLKSYLPKLLFANEGETHTCEITLPAGNQENVNPGLLTGFLAENFGLEESRFFITRQFAVLASGERFM